MSKRMDSSGNPGGATRRVLPWNEHGAPDLTPLDFALWKSFAMEPSSHGKGGPDVELAYLAPKGLKFLFWLSFLIIIGAPVAAPRTGFFTCGEPPSRPKASEAAADI